jgi:hypothetical protein
MRVNQGELNSAPLKTNGVGAERVARQRGRKTNHQNPKAALSFPRSKYSSVLMILSSRNLITMQTSIARNLGTIGESTHQLMLLDKAVLDGMTANIPVSKLRRRSKNGCGHREGVGSRNHLSCGRVPDDDVRMKSLSNLPTSLDVMASATLLAIVSASGVTCCLQKLFAEGTWSASV